MSIKNRDRLADASMSSELSGRTGDSK